MSTFNESEADHEILDNLPAELERFFEELKRLRDVAWADGSKIGEKVEYKNHLAMFLSDIKIALMNGQISPGTFDRLKGEFL